MRPLGSAEENEMILAFLQAEIDSPRYGIHYARMLTFNHLSRSVLIDNADLSGTQDNYFRKELLRAIRGYASNAALFTGFPSDVIWQRVLIEQSDYPRLKYMNDPSWVAFSGGSRLVTEGAKHLERTEENRDPKPNVNGILRRIGEGRRLAPLIAVQSGDGFLILIEGHSRATAYIASGFVTEFEMFVGSSPAIHKWYGF